LFKKQEGRTMRDSRFEPETNVEQLFRAGLISRDEFETAVQYEVDGITYEEVVSFEDLEAAAEIFDSLGGQ